MLQHLGKKRKIPQVLFHGIGMDLSSISEIIFYLRITPLKFEQLGVTNRADW
jgi:hypothetical protein